MFVHPPNPLNDHVVSMVTLGLTSSSSTIIPTNSSIDESYVYQSRSRVIKLQLTVPGGIYLFSKPDFAQGIDIPSSLFHNSYRQDQIFLLYLRLLISNQKPLF